ncbi:hypothetical protein TNCV_1605451 [Trichonephila clavipes]|nr:hypothetical protein TNCV_1605451 [Trichonephila clavipes]
MNGSRCQEQDLLYEKTLRKNMGEELKSIGSRKWNKKSNSRLSLWGLRTIGQLSTCNDRRRRAWAYHRTPSLLNRSNSYMRAFCDGPRHFEPWSSDEDDTELTPNYHITPTRGRLSSRQI